MIERTLSKDIFKALGKYPIIGVTGPRQSGKTTLAKMVCPDYTYLNLEDLSLREFAKSDPKDFLETYKGGVIIDEIQYVPELFSYLQVVTDLRQKNGEYIITGSQNFLLLEKITQSLAGRVSLFNLLPLSIDELRKGGFELEKWEEYLINGSYPRKWINDIESFDFYGNYFKTYVESDVRLIKNIMNLDTFQKFVRLIAGRTGNLFNQNSLANELGVDNKTINSWMNLLEVSFIAFRLRPYHKNFNKRLVKTPKIYFYDTGLLCYLLGIRNLNDLQIHFLKGQLFENFIILEALKLSWNNSTYDHFYFWRDSSGNEIDLIIEKGVELIGVEIKSSKTIHQDFFKGFQYFEKIRPDIKSYLVFGGNDVQKRSNCTVIDFKNLSLL